MASIYDLKPPPPLASNSRQISTPQVVIIGVKPVRASNRFRVGVGRVRNDFVTKR